MAWDEEALALEVSEEFEYATEMLEGTAWENGQAVPIKPWVDPSRVIDLTPHRYITCFRCGVLVSEARARCPWTKYCSRACALRDIRARYNRTERGRQKNREHVRRYIARLKAGLQPLPPSKTPEALNAARKKYRARVKADPARYANEKQRKKDYEYGRRESDPEYRERRLKQKREYNARRKARLRQKREEEQRLLLLTQEEEVRHGSEKESNEEGGKEERAAGGEEGRAQGGNEARVLVGTGRCPWPVRQGHGVGECADYLHDKRCRWCEGDFCSKHCEEYHHANSVEGYERHREVYLCEGGRCRKKRGRPKGSSSSPPTRPSAPSEHAPSATGTCTTATGGSEAR